MSRCAGAILVFLFASFTQLHAGEAAGLLKGVGVSGGLVVQVGCGNQAMVEEFCEVDSVHLLALDRSTAKVDAVRKRLMKKGVYGTKCSAELLKQGGFPLVDNIVKLVVIDDPGFKAEAGEIARILSPGGVVLVRDGASRRLGDSRLETVKAPKGWSAFRKAVPSAIDDWSHYMYDATGNPVSRDTMVASPEYLQWVAGPRWSRHHDHMASLHAMVSAGGRVFYVIDEGSTASIMLPSRWQLVARDAFSGVVLWKRPIPRWWTRFQSLKSGIAQLPRKLVATSEHVYITLGLREPVSKLDAVTGEVLATYDGTENTWELIHDSGHLYAVTGSPRIEEEKHESLLYLKGRAPGNPINTRWKGWDRKLHTIDTRTGRTKWDMSSVILPGTVAVDRDTLFFHNAQSIVAVDRKTGKERWVSEPVDAIDIEERGIPTGYMPRLAIADGVLVFAGGRGYDQHMKGETLKMVGINCEDGKVLWEAPHYTSGYQSPEDLFIVNGVVLSPHTTWLKGAEPKNNHVVGVDVKTGELVFDSDPDINDPVWFIHHRCHPARATTDYLLLSKEGIELVDLETGKWKINHWLRGACLYGIMPANGLIYTPMHDCACSADMKLCGLNAVASARARTDSSKIDVTESSLSKGPAYGKVTPGAAGKAGSSTKEWSTYRGDAARSGAATCSVKTDVGQAWKTHLGGPASSKNFAGASKLSAPVVAGGRLYVADRDNHTLHALDAGSGKKVWSFTAGGRIDSPPTVHKGMVLFGSMDGCVYSLRTSDGELVWRFRAVADDRRLMAWGQVESAWPIHGNILIHDDAAWFVAGRSMFLDGGLHMFRLDPATGNVITRETFTGRADSGRLLSGSEEKRLAGLPDVLSTDGENIYMRSGIFKLEDGRIRRKLLPAKQVIKYGGNKPAEPSDIVGESKNHLYSAFGYLDDSWFHRSYWVYNDLTSHRHNYATTGKSRPAGRILVMDDANVYGFGREKQLFNWTSPMEYRLFAEAKEGSVPKPAGTAKGAKGKRKRRPASKALWEQKVPILARGLVLAGDTLFAAGPPDVLDEKREDIREETPEILEATTEQEAAMLGKRGGKLMAFTKSDGKVLAEHKVDAPPVWDGLIAANGKLYMALTDGTVQCWE